ncbi:MAG: hypothetical protein WCK05_14575 [Planctomycetota bacterium]
MENTTELTDEQQRRIRDSLRNPPVARIFTVRNICNLFGVAPRTVRYAIEKGLVPIAVFERGDTRGSGYGVTRKFSEFSAFMIGLTSVTLEAAVSGPTVGRIMQTLLDWAGRNSGGQRGPLVRAFVFFHWARVIVLEIGDGKALRINLHPDRAWADGGIQSPTPMPWTDIETGVELSHECLPVVTVQLDLGRLLTRLQ